MTQTVLFDHTTLQTALDHMAQTITAPEVYLIGIHNGGAKVADAIQSRLEKNNITIHRGNLDITFYRDDLDTIAPNPEVQPCDLPFDVGGKQIWLIDDVIYSGRTIRAAMDELFDYGRPASIKLAVLVDRSGRQLPIQADCIGLQQAVADHCTVKLITTGDWHIEQKQVKPCAH